LAESAQLPVTPALLPLDGHDGIHIRSSSLLPDLLFPSRIERTNRIVGARLDGLPGDRTGGKEASDRHNAGAARCNDRCNEGRVHAGRE
jgi:hypothetical protein